MVGTVDNNIISTSKMTVFHDCVYLSELYVHSDFRSLGLGTKMQQYREKLAVEKFNKKIAYLSCKQFTPRHKRYCKRGYKVAIKGYKIGSDYLIKKL